MNIASLFCLNLLLVELFSFIKTAWLGLSHDDLHHAIALTLFLSLTSTFFAIYRLCSVFCTNLVTDGHCLSLSDFPPPWKRHPVSYLPWAVGSCPVWPVFCQCELAITPHEYLEQWAARLAQGHLEIVRIFHAGLEVQTFTSTFPWAMSPL